MATEHSAAITQTISRFEAAWAEGASPRLEEFIPQEEGDNVELVAELVAVDLERRLKAGEPIRVEDYLDRFPRLATAPDVVVGLIVAEYQHRCRSNPALSVDEYLERFPQYREQLLTQLAVMEETEIGGEQFVTQSITPAAKEAADETADGLLQRMVELGLVAEQTIESRRASLPAAAQRDRQLIDELLKQGDVTAWQLKQLRAGQKTFVLENGRYLLLDELGKGGMGAVYRARHVGLNRDVALKTIDPRQAKNQQLIGRFQREIAVCAKLQHEHIVQAYDMGCHENVHFLVLEYVQGADLASIVKRDGPLAPAEAAAVGLQGAAALVYAHAQGIVHRDIKPHNILLSTDGVSKLLDLGLASNATDNGDAEALTSLTQTGMILGTADYMPPEQAADLSQVDGRSDIYSLGATLYFLVTGQPPFPGGDMMSKMHRLANEEPAPIGQLRRDCPRELTDVVERMLAKRPEERYQSAVEVVQALQPLAAERIAGRHVMTRAVQTAAEADTAAPIAQTVAVTPFAVGTADTVATSMLRPRKQSSLGKWLMAAAIGVPVLIGFGIWAATSGNDTTTSTDESGPATTTGSVSPDLNKPPSEVRAEGPVGHLPSLFSTHRKAVSTAAWSPDGRYIATGGFDGVVYIWDANNPKQLFRSYREHHDALTLVRWSPDGRLIASSDVTGLTHIWRPDNGEHEWSVRGRVYAFAPKNRELLIARRDDSGRWKYLRWDWNRKREIQSLDIPVRAADYSPSGNYLATLDSKTLTLWDLTSPTVTARSLPTPPDAKDLAFRTEQELVVLSNSEIDTVNIESGQILKQFSIPKSLGNALMLTYDARRVFTHSHATGASVIDTATGETIVESQPLRGAEGGDGLCPGMPFSPDALQTVYLNVSTTGFALLDLSHEKRSWWFGESRPAPTLPQSFSVAGARHLVVWPADSDRNISGWDLQTGQAVRGIPEVSHIARDGTLLVFVKDHVESWPIPGSPVEKQEIFPALDDFEGFTDQDTAGWLEDGDLFWLHAIRQPDPKSYSAKIRVWNSRSGAVVATIPVPEHGARWPALQSPMGKTLFSPRYSTPTGGECKGLFAWNVRDATTPRLIDAGPVRFLSADGSRIAAVSSYPVFHSMNIFDAVDGRKLVELPLSKIQRLRLKTHFVGEFSPDGRYLLLLNEIWDLDSNPPIRKWKTEKEPQTPATFNARFLGDERHVIILHETEISVWDFLTNRKLLTIYLLPGKEWFIWNEQSHCWNSSRSAHKSIGVLHRDSGGKEEWIAPFVYESRTDWENEPEKAGLANVLDERRP